MTHTQAWAFGDNIRSRQLARSFKAVRKQLAKARKKTPKIIGLFCGDLNFVDVNPAYHAADPCPVGSDPAEYDKQWRVVKNAFPNARDLFREKYPDKKTHPGYTCDPVLNTHPRLEKERSAARDEAGVLIEEKCVRERLDYVICLEERGRKKFVWRSEVHVVCEEIQIVDAQDENGIGLSDHFGLEARLKIVSGELGAEKKGAERQDGWAEKQDGGAEKQDGGAEKKDGGAEKKDGGAEKQDGGAEKKDGAEKQDGAENQDGAEKQKGVAENQDGGAENPDGGPSSHDKKKHGAALGEGVEDVRDARTSSTPSPGAENHDGTPGEGVEDVLLYVVELSED